MAYGNMCPLPAHILSRSSEEDSDHDLRPVQELPATRIPELPVMGAWVATAYRPDDIIILRRNPYYWKVDEKPATSCLIWTR